MAGPRCATCCQCWQRLLLRGLTRIPAGAPCWPSATTATIRALHTLGAWVRHLLPTLVSLTPGYFRPTLRLYGKPFPAASKSFACGGCRPCVCGASPAFSPVDDPGLLHSALMQRWINLALSASGMGNCPIVISLPGSCGTFWGHRSSWRFELKAAALAL